MLKPLNVLAFFFLAYGLAAQDGQGGADRSPGQNITAFWREALGGSVIAIPQAQAGSVAVICDGGNLKAYSWEGTFLFDYYARGRLRPYLSRSPEGTCYIGRTNGRLIAVNRAGRELWAVNPGGQLTAPVITGWDGRLFVTTDRNISCYTAAGYRLWEFPLNTQPIAAPCLDAEGGLIVVMERGELLNIDPMGRIRARRLAPNLISALPVRLGEDKRILAVYGNGALELLYIKENGEGQKADTSIQTGNIPLPSLPGQFLYAASRDGKTAFTLGDGRVTLLDIISGQFLWTGESHIRSGEVSSQSGTEAGGGIVMQWDERGIYVLTKSGATGFSEEGRRLWIMELKGAASPPVFSDEGILYSGGTDWILYAYRLEERVRVRRQSLYGPLPEGSYRFANPDSLPPLWNDDYFLFNEREMSIRFEMIRKEIEAGRVGVSEKTFTSYLMRIAGAARDLPRGGRVRVQVSRRAEAIRLLSYLGSREIVPFLADIFSQDREVVIKAAAAEAIGRIGVDPEGLAIKAFSSGIVIPILTGEDGLLIAIASAAGSLCRFSGPPLADAGIRLLTTLSGSAMSVNVRNQAQKELDSLRR
ncbi:MAG: PQQ-binding-like beta-propeller repeat protein [Treponema sp.]|jgi:outer membrane protein assembly factor BamB|nr:PQQ-binding-like beta-propeller repeat protein [Treponema sp.]